MELVCTPNDTTVLIQVADDMKCRFIRHKEHTQGLRASFLITLLQLVHEQYYQQQKRPASFECDTGSFRGEEFLNHLYARFEFLELLIIVP